MKPVDKVHISLANYKHVYDVNDVRHVAKNPATGPELFGSFAVGVPVCGANRFNWTTPVKYHDRVCQPCEDAWGEIS